MRPPRPDQEYGAAYEPYESSHESIVRVMTSLPILFAVDASLSGERLDRALAATLPGMSRTRAQAIIEGERVRVNGRPAKASLRLEEGMRVEVLPPPHPEDGISRVFPGDLRRRQSPLAGVPADCL